jgi:hypothetical protein
MSARTAGDDGGVGASADAGGALAGPRHALYLPEPTGPCPVGTTSLHLTDTTRPDPWAAGVDVRELMVSLWYPAAGSDGPPARYMTPAESELQLTSRGITAVPPDVLSRVRTNAVSDARPTGTQRSLPLVVLSPGFTNSRSALTALAEDLASHGYVVAGIDHTYESFATAFPDGRITKCLARQGPLRDAEKVAAGRAADVSFVVGELTGAHPAWQGAGLIDLARMAMAGHSAGGAASCCYQNQCERICPRVTTGRPADTYECDNSPHRARRTPAREAGQRRIPDPRSPGRAGRRRESPGGTDLMAAPAGVGQSGPMPEQTARELSIDIRQRYEPRNLTFAGGLDHWVLGGSFTENTAQSHWQDYSAAAGHGTAVLSATVPQPAGFAWLAQEMFADDYRGAAVTFRGQFRIPEGTGPAGLFLRVVKVPGLDGPFTAQAALADSANHIVTLEGPGDWTTHEVTAPIPDDANTVAFGLFLAGPGQIELRAPELTRD